MCSWTLPWMEMSGRDLMSQVWGCEVSSDKRMTVSCDVLYSRETVHGLGEHSALQTRERTSQGIFGKSQFYSCNSGSFSLLGQSRPLLGLEMHLPLAYSREGQEDGGRMNSAFSLSSRKWEYRNCHSENVNSSLPPPPQCWKNLKAMLPGQERDWKSSCLTKALCNVHTKACIILPYVVVKFWKLPKNLTTQKDLVNTDIANYRL